MLLKRALLASVAAFVAWSILLLLLIEGAKFLANGGL